MVFFTELENILKFVWKHKRTQIAKTILRRQKLKVPNFLISNYTTKLQQSKKYGDWNKIGHLVQWNRVESPEINPYLYGQLIYYKGGDDMQ